MHMHLRTVTLAAALAATLTGAALAQATAEPAEVEAAAARCDRAVAYHWRQMTISDLEAASGKLAHIQTAALKVDGNEAVPILEQADGLDSQFADLLADTDTNPALSAAVCGPLARLKQGQALPELSEDGIPAVYVDGMNALGAAEKAWQFGTFIAEVNDLAARLDAAAAKK